MDRPARIPEKLARFASERKRQKGLEIMDFDDGEEEEGEEEKLSPPSPGSHGTFQASRGLVVHCTNGVFVF